MDRKPTLRNLTSVKFGKPKAKQNELLKQLGAPHVASFDYMADEGLRMAVADLQPVTFSLPRTATGTLQKVTLKIVDCQLEHSVVPANTIGATNHRLMPSECRQRAATYKGKCSITVQWFLNGTLKDGFVKDMGEIPIMVKSSRCHLANLSPSQLVANGEHEDEWGGYFIVRGHERIIRMLLMNRRNFPIAIQRSSWRNRGNLFTDYGVLVRCVKMDQTATTNVLHFLSNGSAKVMFSHRRILYYVPLPLILKCLVDCSDQFIYNALMQGKEDDTYYSSCLQSMLRDLHENQLNTSSDCRNYLGQMFRSRFNELTETASDAQVADFIIRRCVLIHLEDPTDKFNLFVLMARKLFAVVTDKCLIEGADCLMMQEVLLGGHLYLQILKEKMQSWLGLLKQTIVKRYAGKAAGNELTTAEVTNAAKHAGNFELGMENFLSTGNLVSPSGLGLMQDRGLVVMAENINRMRYMAHFRAVHRGTFYQTMRTTEVRQLLPDAWGFVCPVHTPDGAPCGLLNHLAMDCRVATAPEAHRVANIPATLESLGVVNVASPLASERGCYTVVLDGRVVGYVPARNASSVAQRLRQLKVRGQTVPDTMEIVLVAGDKPKSQFPGLYLFTGPARLLRPVMNLAEKTIEWIGTLEQVYLDICIKPAEAFKGVTTHMELSKTAFLSNLASLIPMPDCNQSPRNMYQCQMGKQTMGTPIHTWATQAETKMYRLQTPNTPLFRPAHYDRIGLDDFAMGTNAIVAVISYTGYDMEDAIIINKASIERGLAHGSVYKSHFVELETPTCYFRRNPDEAWLAKYLDPDGLPFPGSAIEKGDPLCSFFDSETNKYVVEKYSEKETAYLDSVRLCGTTGGKQLRKACIVYRIPRNPNVGDKFASRAGQKGICSQMWQAEDLPFTATGLVPDIVFNPHGFPSRMTIAMMIEIMAGKSAAIHGLVHDATPFKFNERETAIDYFGKLLEAGGYNYYGTETMYSGIDGREMEGQIFFGVVHYQRLRHMVADKWQVRSTGPIDALTHQPIKGRSRGGGVRFGEMERDALISHGTAYLLQDRLFHCSDEATFLTCTSCGTILGPMVMVTRLADKPHLTESEEICRLCNTSDNISPIQLPFIFKYFVTEMASVNINVKINCGQI